MLDGGTTEDGQPYLVMEYVDGQPITDFCAARRAGDPRSAWRCSGRCAAPCSTPIRTWSSTATSSRRTCWSTADGVPKLLDFGIAKLLASGVEADRRPTATMLPMMTPEYASPEQVKGETVTTASDVYSLGVLLYELLTGRRPYRFNSLPEIAQAICESEPTRPSAAVDLDETDGSRLPAGVAVTGFPAGTTTDRLRKHLKGDLDNIVLMAMRKEPARRYASVEQLSDDIARYLAALPVRARSDTFQVPVPGSSCGGTGFRLRRPVC